MPIKLGKTSQHHNWPRYMDWPQIGPIIAIKQGKKRQKDKWYPIRAPTGGGVVGVGEFSGNREEVVGLEEAAEVLHMIPLIEHVRERILFQNPSCGSCALGVDSPKSPTSHLLVYSEDRFRKCKSHISSNSSPRTPVKCQCGTTFYLVPILPFSASPKPHPYKPHPCNMPQAKTEVALQFSECCAAEVALQHSLFCNADVILTKSCAAASEKLQCNIEKAA